MRHVWLIFLLCGAASAQIDPEAARLYHAAAQALSKISSFDLEADLVVSVPMNGTPLVQKRHLSLSIRRPDREKYAIRLPTGTDTFVVSDGLVSVSSEHSRKFGTRPAALRPGEVLNPILGGAFLPFEYSFASATLIGDEDLKIDGRTYECTVIRVVSPHMVPEGPIDSIEMLWVEKKTSVMLKKEDTSSSPRGSTARMAVTHFLTGGDVRPVGFDHTPPRGYLEDNSIFETTMLAHPMNGAAFTFAKADGTPLTAMNLAGQPAILSFSAAGCVPCEADLEAFDTAAKSLKGTWGQAYRVVVSDPSVASDAPAKTPVSSDFEGALASVEQVSKQGIQVLPALMVLTPRGTVYRTIQGHVSADYILKLVEDAKAQRPLSAAELLSTAMVYANSPGVIPPVPAYKAPIRLTPGVKALGLAGTVRLGVVVLQDGTVRPNVSVVKSLDPDLDALAVESVQKWLFRPGTQDGKPANVIINVDVQFTKQ